MILHRKINLWITPRFCTLISSQDCFFLLFHSIFISNESICLSDHSCDYSRIDFVSKSASATTSDLPTVALLMLLDRMKSADKWDEKWLRIQTPLLTSATNARRRIKSQEPWSPRYSPVLSDTCLVSPFKWRIWPTCLHLFFFNLEKKSIEAFYSLNFSDSFHLICSVPNANTKHGGGS